mgnify:FL=1
MPRIYIYMLAGKEKALIDDFGFGLPSKYIKNNK